MAPALGSWTGDRAAEVERVQNLFDEARVVLRDDAACVAGLVRDAGAADVEGDVQGELAGDIVGERALVDERREKWIVAGVGWASCWAAAADDGCDEMMTGCVAGGAGGDDLVEARVERGLPLGEASRRDRRRSRCGRRCACRRARRACCRGRCRICRSARRWSRRARGRRRRDSRQQGKCSRQSCS